MKNVIRDLVTFACIAAVVTMLTLLVSAWFIPARSAEPSITLSQHRVVLGSSLRHCPTEDSGRNCTWNIGSPDGNGQGLSFYVDPDGKVTYVWPENPVLISDHQWRWVPGKIRTRLTQEGLPLSVSCMWRTVGDDYSRIRCANGAHYMVGW